MKRIIFLTFVCSLFWQANAQIEFAPIGATWYYNVDNNTMWAANHPHGFDRIVSTRDTIINGYSCRILIRYSRGSCADEKKKFIIKQKQDRVYFYHQNQFNLFLDFGAEVGDTINFSFRGIEYFFDVNDDRLFWSVDTVFSVRAVVEDITVDFQNLRTFTTRILEEDVPYEHFSDWLHIYTEKIGVHNRFMPKINQLETQILAYPHNRFLRCYSDVGFSFVSDKWEALSLPCDFRVNKARQYQPIFGNESTQWIMPRHDVTTIESWKSMDTILVVGIEGEYKVLEHRAQMFGDIRPVGKVRANETNSRLYFMEHGFATEVLIMDLDLEVGDEFNLITRWWDGREFDHIMVVDSVFVLDGRKHIRFDDPINDDFAGGTKRMFIEGVGPNWGFFFHGLIACKYDDFVQTFSFENEYIKDCNFLHPTTIEFAPIGAVWYYNISDNYMLGDIRPEHFKRVISKRDTIINGYHCRVLIQYHSDSNEKYIIRQKGSRVYFYYQNQFNLFLDFGAEVGDTINFSFRGTKYFFDSSQNPAFWQVDTISSVRAVVEDITLNAQNLRTFTTRILEEDRLDYYFPYLHIYTEKIGVHNRFIPRIETEYSPTIILINRFLRCYSDAGFSFVSDEWAALSLPCDYSSATSINTTKTNNVKIYPNPFSDNIFIFTNNDGSVEIINVLGKVVHSSELLQGTNEIATNHFSKGLFVVKIRSKDSNSIQTFKIVRL